MAISHVGHAQDLPLSPAPAPTSDGKFKTLPFSSSIFSLSLFLNLYQVKKLLLFMFSF